ncbi:hypothetical protein APHAL10511_000827 [Amanita phalloides]|nr:hypothetical protein APHAL10511_000827 [Amanita phalloides]
MYSERRLYSDFFTSGLLNIADSSSSRRYSDPSLYPMSLVAQTHNKFLPAISTPPTPPSSPSRGTKENAKGGAPLYTKAHRRVSSFLPNSSKKWLGRIYRSRGSLCDKDAVPSRCPRVNVADEKVDVWITSGGPYLLDHENSDSDVWLPSPCPDGFDGKPDGENSGLPAALGSLSPAPLSLDTHLTLSLKRRERPTSIQTLPLPVSTSRRSSLQRWPFSDKSEKRDSFNLCVWRDEHRLQDGEHDDAEMDWREFHATLLYNTDTEDI